MSLGTRITLDYAQPRTTDERAVPLLDGSDSRDALDAGALRGLDEVAASTPAGELLARVSWDGLALDPAETPAFEFLALL